MRGKRGPKLKRVNVEEIKDEDGNKEEGDDEKDKGKEDKKPAARAPKPSKRRKKGSDLGPVRVPLNPGEKMKDRSFNPEGELYEFCCFRCHCTNSEDELYQQHPCISAGQDELFEHRTCCHGVTQEQIDSQDWKPPFWEAMADAYPNEEEEEEEIEVVSCATVLDASRNTEKINAALWNETFLTDVSSILNTSDQYVENRKEFYALPERGAAVVLDVFAGIGAGIVALKRHGINIRKVVHVEHDKVATHVYRCMHDYAYAKSYEDYCRSAQVRDGQPQPKYQSPVPEDERSIEHVYFEKFEYIFTNWKQIAEEHGPFDILLAGPPCVDFTGANANRQGIKGEQGRYILELGQLYRRLQDAQEGRIFFCVENVPIQSTLGLDAIRRTFGLEYDPVRLDAREVSPCCRDRIYFTNIPVDIKMEDHAAFDVCASELLNDGYKFALSHFPAAPIETKTPLSIALAIAYPKLAASVRERSTPSDADYGYSAKTHDTNHYIPAKAPCLMASSVQLDDGRMLVFKKDDADPKLYHKRTLNVCEREALLGFKDGYVDIPVKSLFRRLFLDGFVKKHKTEHHWEKIMPESLHHFNSNYHNVKVTCPFKFKVENFEMEMMLAPRSAKKKPFFLTAEQYAKRLIGNSFSIPVMDILLRELCKKFAKREYSEYGSCKYQFKWHQKMKSVSPTQGIDSHLSESIGDEAESNELVEDVV